MTDSPGCLPYTHDLRAIPITFSLNATPSELTHEVLGRLGNREAHTDIPFMNVPAVTCVGFWHWKK